jgi:hypothetical protein
MGMRRRRENRERDVIAIPAAVMNAEGGVVSPFDD